MLHPVVILRHLFSVLLLPFVMVVVVPRWLTTTNVTDSRWMNGRPDELLGRLAGTALFFAGFVLFAWCVWLFATAGKGTLAPWDPTKRLVAVGPYRHLRNPMISGVGAMLAGEALFHGSYVLAGWFACFMTFNHMYFVMLEEPGLERRFGSDYALYKAAVPRWLPRTAPWKGE